MRTWIVLLILFLACSAIPALAEEVNLIGKWGGTWSTGPYRGSFALNLVQAGNELSGKVLVGGRPSPSVNFEVPLSGKVDGTSVRIDYVTPEGIGVAVELKSLPGGKLQGTGHRADGVRIEISLKKSD